MKLRSVVVLATGALALLLAAPALARVEVVTKRPASFPHFRTIQAAVDAARPGDWVLIAPGVYPESVRITTDRLHLRGLDRNRVILDGRHRRNANGIEVLKADGVWIENLTVRNFDRARGRRGDGDNGNALWWNGGDGSGRIGMRGWYGQYLTAFNTGLHGNYGLFTSNAIGGWWRNVYASGFNDAGLYVGACRDCFALVDRAVSENNALGYSGTNSGGHLVVQNSIFRHNSQGITPNSLGGDDPPPPQDGACNAGANRAKTPTFASTAIARCTVFRNNQIVNNDNLTSPAQGDTLNSPWGIGVQMPGDYADLVQGNTIRGNPNFGILIFENPDPFPPGPRTVFFQASGNRVSGNTFMANGARAGGADIGLEGGAFGSMQSVNNCFAQNSFTSSIPAGVEGTWGCQNQTTPNGGPELVGQILTLLDESQHRHSVPQPTPGPQPTMPRPCRGVPRNPLC
jgi:hypothetical protein